MSKNNILILGDVHLGRSQNLAKQYSGSVLNSRITDQIDLLDWVYEQAVEHNIKHIVLTGDVFEDPKPHYNIIVIFMDWIKKCTDYDISVHIIMGNHDMFRSGQFTTSALDVISSSDLDKVYIYKKISTLHLDDVGITFMPFRDRRSFNTDLNSEALKILRGKLPYEVSSISDISTKILIGHLALEGAIPIGYELDELSNELFCPLDMFKGYDYVWMGHIHKFQIMSEKPYVAHIGSMDISDYGEKDHKKYIAIIKPGTEEVVKYIELPNRKLDAITITIPDNGVNANEYIDKEISKLGNLNDSIVKFSIILPDNSSHSINRAEIEKKLYNAGAFFISKISEERTFSSLKKQINEKMDNSVNELSAIKTYSSLVDENIKEEFISLANNIIKEYKENSK